MYFLLPFSDFVPIAGKRHCFEVLQPLLINAVPAVWIMTSIMLAMDLLRS